MTFAAYSASLTCHQAEFARHYREVAILGDLAAAFRELGGMRALVLTEDWCPDSVFATPLLARLAEAAGTIGIDVQRRSAAPEIAARYQGHDGKSRIPVVAFSTPNGREMGYWSERCAASRDWMRAFVETDPVPAKVFHHGQPAPELLAWMRRRLSAQRELELAQLSRDTLQEWLEICQRRNGVS